MDCHVRQFVALVGNRSKIGEDGPAENMPAEDKPAGGTVTC
jgi:hypothetical protein